MPGEWDGRGWVRTMAQEGTHESLLRSPFFTLLTHSRLSTTPEGTGQYYPHFTEERMEAQKYRD